MSISKSKREAVRMKFGGKCAYCGCELKKGWHVDHIEPVIRNPYTKKMYLPERDIIENMNPSCPPCNIHKHSLSIEEFRRQIEYHTKAMNRASTQYKFLKKFGLIEETGKKVVFYFEKFNKGEVK